MNKIEAKVEELLVQLSELQKKAAVIEEERARLASKVKFFSIEENTPFAGFSLSHAKERSALIYEGESSVSYNGKAFRTYGTGPLSIDFIEAIKYLCERYQFWHSESEE